MSKWRVKEVIVEAEPYSPGMEDGWMREFFVGGVVTRDGGLSAAYILVCGGRMLIPRDGYILKHSDGTRSVQDKKSFEEMHEPE